MGAAILDLVIFCGIEEGGTQLSWEKETEGHTMTQVSLGPTAIANNWPNKMHAIMVPTVCGGFTLLLSPALYTSHVMERSSGPSSLHMPF